MRKISILLVIIFMSGLLAGCAVNKKTATEQIAGATSDGFKIARAMYLDAMWSYKGAALTFKEYRSRLKEARPELYIKIQDGLWDANNELKKLKAIADLGKPELVNDKLFNAQISNIAFLIADIIDGKETK